MEPYEAIILAIVLGTGIGIFIDMKKNGLEDENEKDPLIGKRKAWRWGLTVFAFYMVCRWGVGNMTYEAIGRLGANIVVFIVWSAVFPFYFYKRKKILESK